MANIIKRRDFLQVTAGGTLGALFLSACGGSGGGPAETSGTVNVWSAFATDEQKRYYQEKVLGGFNASHDDIPVKLSVKTFETIDQLLRTAMAAGKGPDIVPTPGPSYAASYVAAGQFVALDDLAKEHGWTESLLPWAVSTGTIDGKLYAIPSEYESMLLLYNPATFDQHGWTPPKTRSDFEAICTDAASKGIMPVATGNADWQPTTEHHVTNVFNAMSGADALFQALNGDLPWTDPVFVDAISLLKGYFDKEWFGGGAQAYFTNKTGPLYNDLATGAAAMMVTGSWALPGANQYFGEEAGNDATWEWAALPSLSDAVHPEVFPLGVGATLSINQDSASPENAATYIDFMMDPQRQGQGLAEAKLQPFAVKLTDADFPAEVDDRFKRFYTEVAASKNLGYTTWTFWPPKSNTYLYREMDKVLLGDVSPAEYCAGLNEVFQQEFQAGKVTPVAKLGD